MSLGFLRFVVSQALSRGPLRPIRLVTSRMARSPSTLRPACSCHSVSPSLCMSFSTDTESGSTSVTDVQKETKKLDPRARVTFGSVGRKIGQRHVKLLGPVQSKELVFSSDISVHDLDTKLRQVVSWLEKNNHVRLTVRAGNDGTPLDKVLTQMVERISVPVGFVSNPSVVRGGRATMCVLRLASAKELQKKGAETSNKNLKPDSETPASLRNSSTEDSKDLKQQ